MKMKNPPHPGLSVRYDSLEPLGICRSIQSLDLDSDPADEIIAATSLVHRVPLMTRDRKMHGSRVVPLVL